MNDIYTKTTLKYPLTQQEYAIIDDAWEFIGTFNISYLTLRDYRRRLINRIKDKYTPEQFNQYEQIAEKLYWNLYHYYIIFNPDAHAIITTETQLITPTEMQYVINNDVYYRSFINKMFIPASNNIYYRKPIGSCPIMEKNEYLLTLSTIFMDRTNYEQYMLNSTIPTSLPQLYNQFDYGFPNLNICVPFIYTNEARQNKINKFYYCDNAEENWFRMIQ